MTLRSPHTPFAALAVIIACFMLAGMDAIGKYLQLTLPSVQVVWARYFSHFLLFIAIAAFYPQRKKLIQPKRPWLQMLRSILLMGVTIFFYQAIIHISLADATAVLFFSPVMVTLLASLFLKEDIEWFTWLAVILGFIGVLVIIRPGSDTFDPAILLPLLSAASLTGYLLLTRYLKDHDEELTTIFLTPVAGTALLSLFVAGYWHTPTVQETLLLGSLGLLGAGGHILLTFAFHRASASILSPLLYAQLVGSTIFSALFFDDVLEPLFYLGAGLVIIAGVLVSLHHGKK
jgi:drug/metabolite transporter (DMT)-like permease